MGQEIFRKKALEHLSSPDDIDQSIRLADRKGWLALIALILCLVIAGIWSWYGRIPINVTASGLIIREGGLMGIVTQGDGQIQDILISVGDDIRSGQVVTRLYRPDIQIKLHNAQLALNTSQKIHQRFQDYISKRVDILDNFQEQKRVSLQDLIEKLKEQENFLTDRLGHMKTLYKSKIIPPIKVEEERVKLDETINRINKTNIELSDTIREHFKIKSNDEIEILKSAKEVAENQQRVAEMLLQLEINTVITSQFSGRVVEIRTKPGNVVRSGQIIAMLENVDEKKSAVLFLDSAEGRKAKPGMTVRIFPSTVKREEYGGIFGIVTKVSPYFISSDALIELLGNKVLAEQFIKQANGSPVMVMIDLIPSSNSPSGYYWTSSQGPDTNVQTGTIVQGEITIKNTRPLSLVLPIIKHIFGI